MKTLTVYISSSFYKYPHLFKQHRYEITDLKHLQVYSVNPFSGEENLSAHFNNWDYFTIEEEKDD